MKDKYNPEVGEIWKSGNGWHVLILEETDDPQFFVLFLEDGLYSYTWVDVSSWTRVS